MFFFVHLGNSLLFVFPLFFGLSSKCVCNMYIYIYTYIYIYIFIHSHMLWVNEKSRGLVYGTSFFYRENPGRCHVFCIQRLIHRPSHFKVKVGLIFCGNLARNLLKVGTPFKGMCFQKLCKISKHVKGRYFTLVSMGDC